MPDVKGELVPRDVKEDELRDEVNHRTHAAGYTTRTGGPIPRRIIGVVSWGAPKYNVWPRGRNGELIE